MPEITYATIQERWAEELAAIERAAFPTAGMVDLLSVEDIRILCGTFPEGGFVALDGDRPVGMGVGDPHRLRLRRAQPLPGRPCRGALVRQPPGRRRLVLRGDDRG